MSETPSDEVPLARDHYWWLHPALRGQEALPGQAGATLPWRWQEREAAQAEPGPQAIDPSGPYADFAKLLYKMNGYRPGLVTGWYVVVEPEPGQFAVGQLAVDPNIPVVLFSDEVYPAEADARAAAAGFKAERPGLLHQS